MRVIKPLTVRRYYEKHRDAGAWLKSWLVVAKAARWRSLEDVRRTYRRADTATVASGSTVTTFDVKGNRYRLIVAIHYNMQRVYIRDFMTHEEYNSQLWKRRH
jgi:mRNA interferase HigB